MKITKLKSIAETKKNYILLHASMPEELLSIVEFFLFHNPELQPVGGPFFARGEFYQAFWHRKDKKKK